MKKLSTKNGFTPTRQAGAGFTIIELLMVMGIFIMFVLMSIPAYFAIRDNIALNNDSYEIVNALRLAQGRSIVSMNGALTHGVYFATSSYTLFDGDWPGPIKKTEYQLKRGVSISSGAGDKVVFSRLIGDTASTTIVVETSPSKQRIIRIGKTGNIVIK